jgi:hypothetical protein
MPQLASIAARSAPLTTPSPLKSLGAHAANKADGARQRQHEKVMIRRIKTFIGDS